MGGQQHSWFTGIVLLLVILPFLVIRFVYAPWLDQQSRARFRALRYVPDEVSDHVLICANDPIALGLLELAGMRGYVIDPDVEHAMRMRDA